MSFSFVLKSVLLVLFVGSVSDAHAAAAVQRRAQQGGGMQEQIQQQMYQQAIAQKQAQEVAAYQQAMAQQQAAMQQQAYQQAAYQKAAAEYAAYKQAMQQAVAQRNAELQAAEQVKSMVAQKRAQQVAQAQQAAAYKNASELVQYRQAQDARAVAEVQARAQTNEQIRQYTDFLTKRKAAMQVQIAQNQQVQTAQELMQYNEYQKARAMQSRVAVQHKMSVDEAQRYAGARMAKEVMSAGSATGSPRPDVSAAFQAGDEPDTVVDIQELWRALEKSSRAWAQIVDQEIKILTVSEYIDRFGKGGIKIRKSPGYYATMIDSVSAQDPEYLTAPFMNVLSYAAIVDYDFDNGQNPDDLARRVLGEQNFLSNKARLKQP